MEDLGIDGRIILKLILKLLQELRESEHLEDLGIDGRIILKLILNYGRS